MHHLFKTHVENTLSYAQKQDQQDPLSRFRQQFHFPQHEGKDVVYFTGNSLGLQPKAAESALRQELEDWRKYGVEGHFEARLPWYSYHEFFTAPLARLVGAKESEVVAMGTLTGNIHLLMTSFYRPTPSRYKILCEAKAFPSDQYALQAQAKMHGFDPDDAIVEVHPRPGEKTIREEDIVERIYELGESLCTVMIGAVNYFTGQYFDLKAISDAAHQAGASAGFDLAHAMGNVPVKLHDWNVDFAAWCSYKYLNSGPGAVAGIFVHEKHHKRDLVRQAGWWGHDKNARFQMAPAFAPMASAEAWQQSNAPVFNMAIHRVSLELFDEAGLENLRDKSEKLTGFLAFVIANISQATNTDLEIITPREPERRGCQVSIVAHGHGKKLFDGLTRNGVVADWREPNVIRVAPVPLYNSFEDVYRFGEILKKLLKQ